MKMIRTVLFLVLIMYISINCQEAKLPIVPVPQVVNIPGGSYSLPKKVKIVISGVKNALEDNNFTAGLIKSTLKDFNKTDADISEGKSEKGAIVLSLENEPKFEQSISPSETNPEGYKLIISKDGIMIRSISSKGLLYGAMSLIQMLEKTDNNKLACAEISDWPDMKFRGISDDISRGQVPTLDNFKKIIRFMARYKMNVYMPYLEDMLKFDSYPAIGKDRGALTKEEVKELVQYAKKYYIDVIPAFQTLGHYENILSQAEFIKYAEFPGAASLCVSNDSTYTFLETLLKEVCEMFPSEYFNMGADESYDVGLSKSKYLVDKSSLAMVHLEHYKKVYNILKKFGKKVMMYGDIILSHPEILEGLPKDITVIDWHYRPDYDYPSTKAFQTAGIPYIVSPSVWNYTSTFPVNVNAVPNIKYITASGIKNGSIGMINSNWGDFGAETIKELVYFDYAWSAQCAWNYNQSQEGRFTHDFMYDFFGLDDSRLASLYETLSSTLNQITWNELFRHPILPQRDPAAWEAKTLSPMVRISWMESTLPKAEKDINELQQKVKKNKDHFDILKLVVKLSNFYKSKLMSQVLLSGKTAELYKNKTNSSDKVAMAALKIITESRKDEEKTMMALIDNNISSIKSLKEEFKDIWLRYYKKDNLSMIGDKFDRLASYFTEAKQQLMEDGQLKPAAIQSDWIYCKANDSTFAKSARFKKTFNIEDDPKAAYIQFLGDTYARVYINGEYADQVYVKRSLSLWTEYKRIRFFNITRYLKKGENTITVEVDNYLPKGFAGFNLIADIKAGTNSMQVLSDTTWQAQEMNKQDGAFAPAVKRDYPYTVTAPNFETMRSSWIER